MKVVLEVTGFDSGIKVDGERETRWARLTGRSRSGKYCRAVAFGAIAEGLTKELGRMIPQGEEIASVRVIIDVTGEWTEGKEITKGDGSKYISRSFKIDTFAILTGPHLELDRIRRDASGHLDLAEQHRKEGRLDLAYRSVAEYLALITNKPLDLADLEEIVIAADEDEFGSSNSETLDPEAAAAAHFASMDGVSERMEIAVETTVAAETVAEEKAEIEADDNIEFGPETIEAVVASEEEDVAEEPEAADEADADVLDDEDNAAAKAADYVEEPAKTAEPAPSSGPPAPPGVFRRTLRPRPPGM